MKSRGRGQKEGEGGEGEGRAEQGAGLEVAPATDITVYGLLLTGCMAQCN